MMTTALLGLVAQAEDNKQSEWANKAKQIFAKAQSVHLGDAQKSVKEEEKGAYKIEFTDGSVVVSDAAPKSYEKVHAVYKRADAGPQVRKVSGGAAVASGVWARLTKVDGDWKTLSASERNRMDDANFVAFMSHVTGADHGKVHASAVAAAKAVRAAKGDEKAQDAYAKVVSKIKRDLLAKGEELGVGDSLWAAQESALRVASVEGRSDKAAKRFRMKRRAAMSRAANKLS